MVMRVAWVVPRYLPVAPCGAEWTAHELLVELRRRGHDAAAIVVGREAPFYHGVGPVESVPIYTLHPRGDAGQFDVVIGHLGHADELRRLVRPGGRVVWMAHAEYQWSWGSDARPDHWIANAEHVLRTGPPGSWIMRPHTPAIRSVGGRSEGDGDAILLVGATDLKGLPLVRQLARGMPERRFLVVQSGYDRQRINTGRRGNITVWPIQRDGLRNAFAESRLLLVPSVESWGRVAVEAAHCGIPTIAHPSAGITEAMAGEFYRADRGSLSEWVFAVAALDDRRRYELASIAVRARAGVVQERTRQDRDRIIAYLEAAA
jgi:hypothetical protein